MDRRRGVEAGLVALIAFVAVVCAVYSASDSIDVAAEPRASALEAEFAPSSPVVADDQRTERAPEATVVRTRVAESANLARSLAIAASSRSVESTGVRLRGTVRDKSTRSPVQDVTVHAQEFAPAFVGSVARTAADGMFEIADLPPGVSLSIRLATDDMTEQWLPIGMLDVGVSEREFLIDREVIAGGRVLDLDSGAGVADVGVDFAPTSDVRGAVSFRLRTKSGPDGAFAFRGVIPDDVVTLRVTASRSGRFGTRVDIAVAKLRSGSQIILYSGAYCSVEGRVIAPNGLPVAGAEITLPVRLATLRDDWKFVLPSWARTDGRERLGSVEIIVPTVETDADGRFRLTGLLPGSQRRLSVSSELGSIEVVIPPFARCGESQWIEIRYSETTAVIRGTLTLNGKPVASGRVTWQGAQHSGFAVAKADGSFELRAVEAGRIVVTGRGGDLAVTKDVAVDVRAGDRITVDVPIEITDRIRGRVAYGNGTPVAFAKVVAIAAGRFMYVVAGESHPDADCVSDGSGAFELVVPRLDTNYVIALEGKYSIDRPCVYAPGASEVEVLVTDER